MLYLVYRKTHLQPTKIRKLGGKLNKTGSVHDIQQKQPEVKIARSLPLQSY